MEAPVCLSANVCACVRESVCFSVRVRLYVCVFHRVGQIGDVLENRLTEPLHTRVSVGLAMLVKR